MIESLVRGGLTDLIRDLVDQHNSDNDQFLLTEDLFYLVTEDGCKLKLA